MKIYNTKLLSVFFVSSLIATGITNAASSGSIVYINSVAHFDMIIRDGLVVADFGTNWCGPCKQMTKVIDDLAKEMQRVQFLKIDTDTLAALAARYNITSIPTFIFFKNGKQVFRCTGSRSKSTFKQEISARLLL